MSRKLFEVRDALDQAQQAKRRLEEEAGALRARVDAGVDDDGVRERLSNVQRGIERRDVEVAELEAEAGQAMAEGLRRGEMAEMPGLEFGPPRDRTPDTGQPNEALRSGALRANEGADFLHERSRAHMERQLRYDDDPNAGLARFTVALADRHYFRAFAKWFNNPFTGGHEWTPKEREAVQRVRTVERSLTLATSGTSGGFLVPYELDPSIILTGQYIDPMREICRVETTAYNVKKFVSSTGSTSSWDTEETEVSDDSPTLSQPSITCKKAATFVPVSIELYEDSDIAMQIGRVFADSKASHESLSFTLTQSNGPVGLISAVVTASTPVIATGTNVLASADVYANAAALGARWRSNAKWMMHGATLNGFRQLPVGTNVQQSLVDDSQTPPKLVGWPVYENSNMDATLSGSAADYLVLSGDFQQYVILDRVGATIEVIPHLMGGSGRPTGQRGFYQHWRVGGDALVPTAFSLSNYST